MHWDSETVWAALHLPRLKTDRLIRNGRAPEDRPLAVYAKQANAFVLTGVDARAAALNLRPGMALADARAIHPALHAVEVEPDEEARALDGIAAWCERFTPIVVVDAPDGLFLDLSGCAHLFGGEDALRIEIVARLAAQGFAARVALAATPGAAWALARYGAASPLPCGGDVLATLAPLPIDALRLEEASVALLRRLGLKTIAQLIAAPRASFAARAGERALLRLDQALGRAREALSPRRPAPPVFALARFLEPLFSVETLLIATQKLCGEAVANLDALGAGARACVLHLFGVDGRDRMISIGLSRPEREAKILLRLFREKLNRAAENLDAEFGIEAARLDVVQMERIESAPRALVAAEVAHANAEQIAAIVDMLNARLGPSRVLRPLLRDAHAPERAGGWFSSPMGEMSSAKRTTRVPRAKKTPLEAHLVTSAGLTPSVSLRSTAPPSKGSGVCNHVQVVQAETPASPSMGEAASACELEGVRALRVKEQPLKAHWCGPRRPLTLFPRPQPIDAIAAVPDGPPIRFRWRAVLREVARAEGPERIAGDWLKGEPTRDFYRVEDAHGRRYWLCREGLYGEASAPRWFVHGLFA